MSEPISEEKKVDGQVIQMDSVTNAVLQFFCETFHVSPGAAIMGLVSTGMFFSLFRESEKLPSVDFTEKWVEYARKAEVITTMAEFADMLRQSRGFAEFSRKTEEEKSHETS